MSPCSPRPRKRGNAPRFRTAPLPVLYFYVFCAFSRLFSVSSFLCAFPSLREFFLCHLGSVPAAAGSCASPWLSAIGYRLSAIREAQHPEQNPIGHGE